MANDEKLEEEVSTEKKAETSADLKQDMETIREDISKLRSDLSDITRKLVEIGKGETGVAKQRVEEEARKLLDELYRAFDITRERSRESVRDFEDTIEERPFFTLFMAFLIGLILGKIFDRD